MIGRVLSEGFRVFFLSAASFGLLAGLAWTLYLARQWGGGDVGPLSYAMPPVQWHAHEMIFGYASAAIGGFFLTAVPNWTNAPGAKRAFITLVAGLWLLGRVAVWYSAFLPPPLVAVLDLAFVPVLAAKILSQLLKRPKPQNMMFLVFLTFLWIGNLLVHLEWLGLITDSADAGLRMGLVTLVALISILGGRITPAFTRNAMNRDGMPESSWPQSFVLFDRAALILALLTPILVGASAPVTVTGAALLAMGVVQLLRLMRWRGLWALKQPILAALHVSLAMMGLGLIAWGLALLGFGSEVAGLHLLGIGGVGGMTVAVMSRATLGHAGRPLVAPGPVALGYGLIVLAALLRWLGSTLGDGWYEPTIMATGVLWVAVYALFLVSLWPALTGPRQK